MGRTQWELSIVESLLILHQSHCFVDLVFLLKRGEGAVQYEEF